MLTKTGPLSTIYRKWGPQITEVSGWKIAEHFGDPELEKNSLETGSVLVDWSHIGKISLFGKGALDEAIKIDHRSKELKPLHAWGNKQTAVLRLAEDEFLILCLPGIEDSILKLLDFQHSAVLNESGGMGCFALGGIRRDEVLERSCAMNLRRDTIGTGSAVQTTIHTIPCTLFRTHNLEIIVHSRDFSQSLFEALMDVGEQVGLIPSGILNLPVSFETGE